MRALCGRWWSELASGELQSSAEQEDDQQDEQQDEQRDGHNDDGKGTVESSFWSVRRVQGFLCSGRHTQ